MRRPLPAAGLLVAAATAGGGWLVTASVGDPSTRAAIVLVLLAVVLGAAGLALLVWTAHQRRRHDPVRLAAGRAARVLGAPWRWSGRRTVLVFGPTAAGKTTLLRARGGSLQVLDRGGGPLPDGPTDACTFALVDDVLLVDTAGRYADGGPADAEEATRLLRRLAWDPRLPRVEALVLAVPLTTLLGPDDARADTVARLARLAADAAGRLRRALPVHVVLTRSDEISGFGALVAALPPALRRRALGRSLCSDAGALHREVAAGLADLRRALDRAAGEVLPDVPLEADRAALLALSAEVAALESALVQLVQALASPCRPAGFWFTGSDVPGGHARAGARVGRALGLEATRGASGAPGAPAFAEALLAPTAARAPAWHARPRARAAARVSLIALLLAGGLGLFRLAHHELRHLDTLTAGLSAVHDARSRPDPEAWSLQAQGITILSGALHDGVTGSDRPVASPAHLQVGGAPLPAFPFASRRADAAAVGALRHAIDGSLLTALRAALVSRGEAAAAALSLLDPATSRLDRQQVEALRTALGVRTVGRALEVAPTPGAPRGCGDPAEIATRLVALRPTGSAAVDRDLARALTHRLAVGVAPWTDDRLHAVLGRIDASLVRLTPELRAFSGRLATVADALTAPPAAEGLDASTWPAEALRWRPSGLDGTGCVAFHAPPPSSTSCASEAAEPAGIAARYAAHHRDQWRRWLGWLQVPDVRARPHEPTADLAAEIRRVLGPGRDLDRALSRVGVGRPAGACDADAPSRACCVCACLAAEWSLAHQLGAGGVEAWTALQGAADQLATAVEAVDGPGAARMVAETAQGKGPLVAFHEAARRVLTTVVPTPPEPPTGCACPAVSHPLAEAEVRARVESVTTALASRAWWQVLRRLDEHLHRRWRDDVLAAWRPLSRRFPLDPGAPDDAAPADVVAFLGCEGTLATFLAAQVRPLADAAAPRWGRAATLAWSAEAQTLLAGVDTLCRRVDALEQPRTVQLGLRYVAGSGADDVAGIRVTIDGRSATYQFGRPLDPFPARRDTVVSIEALRGSPPKIRCPRYGASAGDWPLWRLLARPLVVGAGARPPFDRPGLSFPPPADLERCGGSSLGGHQLTYREEADGPAASLYALASLRVPERLFDVRLPD